MRKINENSIIQNLTLMEQKLLRDVILKENVLKMCGKFFVQIKNHLQSELEECPRILACV